jgi:integrase
MGDIKDSTKKMRLAKLKHFLREAYRVDWTLIPLVDKMAKFEGGGAKGAQPFNVTKTSDQWNEDEVNRVLEVAGTVVSRSGYGSNPATFRLQCELMNETGMRVSDTISFDPRLCVASGDMFAYTYCPKKQRHAKKTPLTATVYLTERLKVAIESCEWMSEALPFAYCGPIYRYPAKPAKGEIDLTEKLALEVYKRLHTVIGPKAGVSNCRPHRFRDTFAIRLIVAGMDLLNVSKALNHSNSKITEEYYLIWFEGRTKKLVTELHGILTKLHQPAIVAKAA